MQLNPRVAARVPRGIVPLTGVAPRAAIGVAIGAAIAVAASPALADGEISVRGAYFKEKATRVVQPMTDVRLDIDEDTEVTAHVLLDAITSASAAAGSGIDANGNPIPFTENRYEAGGSVTRRMDTFQITAFGRYSDESDYRSIFGGLRTSSELAQKNTTLGLSLAFGHDDISNEGAQQGDDMMTVPDVRGELTTALGSVSLTQVLSPVLVGGFTYDVIYQEGFLENAYRRVPVAGTPLLEDVPDTRLRHALFASLRGFIPPTRTTLLAGYRLYLDDWDLFGHTPELRVIQEIDEELLAHAHYRFHSQSEAFFYRTVYDEPQRFFTDDVKLGAFTSHTFGIKLDTALSVLGAGGGFADYRADLVIDYVVQNNRFGNAVVAQLGLEIPLEY